MDAAPIPNEYIERTLPDDLQYRRDDNIGTLIIQAADAIASFHTDSLGEAQDAYAQFVLSWCYRLIANMPPKLPLVVLAATVQSAADEAGIPRPQTDALVYAMQVHERANPTDRWWITQRRQKIGWFYACTLAQ